MNRIFYLDLLKGVSIFFVVLLHTAGLGLSMTQIGSFTWQVCNVFDSLSRFVVPVFVMISGALVLIGIYITIPLLKPIIQNVGGKM